MALHPRASTQWWFSGGLVVGGILVMAGATLPWLTLYAGFQPYSGMIGVNGWIAFAAGIVALAAGAVVTRRSSPWIVWATDIFGAGLLAFTLWLFVGLMDILHRQGMAMLVPRAGPGLFVILGGAALIILAPIPHWIVERSRKPVSEKTEG